MELRASSFLGRVDEADQRLPFLEQLDAVETQFRMRLGRPHLHDDVGRTPQMARVLHELHTHLGISLVAEVGCRAGVFLELQFESQADQVLGGLGGQRHPLLTLFDLFRNADQHAQFLVVAASRCASMAGQHVPSPTRGGGCLTRTLHLLRCKIKPSQDTLCKQKTIMPYINDFI